jgi:hypothetical protein
MGLLQELELERAPDWILNDHYAAQLTRFSSEFIRRAIRQGNLLTIEPLPGFRRIHFTDLASWFDTQRWREVHATKFDLNYYGEQSRRLAVQDLNHPLSLYIHARDLTKHAHKIGALVRKPCEICGEPKSEAHHDDYTKPLAVRYLCRLHHAQCHTGPRQHPNWRHQQKALKP